MKKLTGIELAAFGYVHVTGLRTTMKDSLPIQVVQPNQLGRHDSNNGMTVVNTVNGEVWISLAGMVQPNDSKRSEFAKLLSDLCPNGVGAFVPCSNGETVEFRHLLARVANPCWEGSPSGVVGQFGHLLVGG